jgi:hypothetical protein
MLRSANQALQTPNPRSNAKYVNVSFYLKKSGQSLTAYRKGIQDLLRAMQAADPTACLQQANSQANSGRAAITSSNQVLSKANSLKDYVKSYTKAEGGLAHGRVHVAFNSDPKIFFHNFNDNLKAQNLQQGGSK